MARLGSDPVPVCQKVASRESKARDLAGGLHEPIFKRPFDLVLSGIWLLLSLPVWLGIMALIWLEDGRPFFFCQPRIGLGGKLFRVWKFRSMVKETGSVDRQASKNDPRITRVGRVLRRTALDELPQLWNIFRGDMSFVGPRAQPEKEKIKVGRLEKDLYIREVPGYELRQLVRPGLTGVTQIYAPREVPHRNKFRYDLVYVKRIMRQNRKGLFGDILMFWLDLRLICISVWNSLTARWEV